MVSELVLLGLVFFAPPDMERVLQQMQGTREDAQTVIRENLAEGNFAYPRTARAIPVEQRAAAVEVLARFVRGYVETDAFLTWYGEYRESRKPQLPDEFRPAAEQRAARIKEGRKGIADLEAQRGQLPVEARPALDQALETLRQDVRQLEQADPAGDAAADRQAREDNADVFREHDEQLAAWGRELPERNPRPLIARRLRQFLDATAGIDYAAVLVKTGDVLLFQNAEYENKDRVWKLGFRAGREATEKARTLATEWLRELE